MTNDNTARRAWIVGGSILAALALLFGTAQIVSALARERTTEVSAFPAAGLRLLDVDSGNGTVEVLGGPVEEITVTARLSHGLRRTEHRATVEGDVLRVRSSCPLLSSWCGVDYRIRVPAEVAVAIDVDNGRLIVRDVNGSVRVDGQNGSIELARLSGDLDVSTHNGRLESTGLRSDNGRVDVVLPEPPDAYRVALDTDNGATDIGVRTDPGSGRSIVGRTRNGDVTVRYATG